MLTNNERELYEALKLCVPYVAGHVALTSLLDSSDEEDKVALDIAEDVLHRLRDPADDLCGRCGHRRGGHRTAAPIAAGGAPIIGCTHPGDLDPFQACLCLGFTA